MRSYSLRLAVDKNLRATWKMVDPRKTWFHPVADGIADLTLKEETTTITWSTHLAARWVIGGCISLVGEVQIEC